MLKRDIDMALVGKSYMSILLSLELLEQGQDVLLLDDPHMGSGELYTDRLFGLEKEYLKAWGEDRKIGPLQDIERYLKTTPTTFIFDKTRVRLGDSPARNCRELMRKMPEVFPPRLQSFRGIEDIENFNRAYHDYCTSLGKIAYRYKNVQSFNLETLQERCPPVLLEIYGVLKEALESGIQENKEIHWKLKTFLYSIQGPFQKKLSSEVGPVELFHLLLCLISSHYELDRENFLKDLIAVNTQRGGQFKRTFIREWMFYRGRPWSVELASYEGIIHPKKMTFVGSIPRRMLVSLRPLIRHYTSLNVEVSYPGSTTAPEGERVFFSTLDRLGTEIPLWEGIFEKRKAHLKFFVLHQPGRKVGFLEERVRSFLLSDLAELLPVSGDDLKITVQQFGTELWVDEEGQGSKGGEPRLKSRQVRLIDLSHPARRKPLKNVYYFGPYRDLPLGMLSTLMEINDQQQFL